MCIKKIMILPFTDSGVVYDGVCSYLTCIYIDCIIILTIILYIPHAHEHTHTLTSLSPAELLVVIRETENDDLTEVMQQLIETYADQMEDVAVSIASNLVR